MHWLCLMPGDDAYPLLFRMCVAIVPCCVSSLLTTPVINSPECEWPQLLAFFQTCWQLSLALQYVCSCHAMLDIKPTDHAFSGFISMWVAAQPHCASRLMTPVPCSLACGWLPCHALYQAYWSCLCMDFQCVSGCCASVYFTPDDTCPWLFSGSVTAVLCWITSLLTAPVLGYLSTLMMPVLQTFRMWVTSDCCPMLCQKPTDNTYPWLSMLMMSVFHFYRRWVTTVLFCVTSLQTTPVLGYPYWWCLFSTL